MNVGKAVSGEGPGPCLPSLCASSHAPVPQQGELQYGFVLATNEKRPWFAQRGSAPDQHNAILALCTFMPYISAISRKWEEMRRVERGGEGRRGDES